jgi:hypothetical protein
MSHRTTSWMLAAAALAIVATLPAAALPSAGAGELRTTASTAPSDAASGEAVQGTEHMTASRFLARMSDSQRAGSIIQLELPAAAVGTYALQTGVVETDWSAGRFAAAISGVQSLEASGVRVNVAVSWPHAQPVSAPSLGSNVQISPNVVGEPGLDTAIDYDQATGNLLAMARATTNFAIYLSTNAGATWAQTASWCCSPGPTDLSAVGGYGYIAYYSAPEMRMRRVFGNTGAFDGVYFYQTIFDATPNNVTEVSTTSNADDFDNRIYTLALVSGGGGLRWLWADASTATSFNEDSPSAPLVASGISQSWVSHWNGVDDYIFLSYRASDNTIRVHGQSAGGVWDSGTTVGSGAATFATTSLSCFDNVVITGYDGTVGDLQYRISYDNGASYLSGLLFDPATEPGTYFVARVSARSGTGTAAVGGNELGAFDDIKFKQRPRFQSGAWQAASPVNDVDFTTGDTSLDMEWMGHGWGITYLDNAGAPWFTWSPAIFYSGFESGDTFGWTSTVSP